MGSVRIGEAALAAVRFWRTSTLRAIGPLALGYVGALMVAWERLDITDYVRRYGREAVSTAWLNWHEVLWVGGGTLEFGGALMALGALYRIALDRVRQGHAGMKTGPAGLDWTGDEWRLAAVAAGVLLVAFYIPFGAFARLFQVAIDSQRDTPGLIGGLQAAMVGTIAALGAVFSLAGPATVATGRLALGLGLTRRRFWPVLAVFCLAVGVPAVGVLALDRVFHTAAEFGLAGAAIEEALWLFVCLPLAVGATAAVYRQLTEPAGDTPPPA